jgi:hypothetical protein
MVALEQRLGPGRVLYGSYTFSQDRDDRVLSQLAAGGRERIDDSRGNARALLYAEDQFRDGPIGEAALRPGEAAGRAHIQAAGVDLPLARRFQLGGLLERGTVQPSGTPFTMAQPLERTAGSVYGSYGGERVRLQLKGELRQDVASVTTPGAPPPTTLAWLASAAATLRPHKDLTLRGKLFASISTGGPAAGSASTGPASTALARSIEATVGFAWRPSFTDRLVLLGRYTYLDEGAPAAQAQSGPLDPITGLPLTLAERAHVMSLAGEGRVVWRIALGLKLAAKRREESSEGTAAWMILSVARLILHVTRAWDALAEYRLLVVPGAQTSQGVALEVNRILVGHLRLGLGYSFTGVSDDEMMLGRGSEHGFFARAQGFY